LINLPVIGAKSWRRHLENYMHSVVAGFGRRGEADLLTGSQALDCNLPDDLMRGADEIAGFVGQLLHREVPPKLIYQWADKGLLPVGKHGGRYLGSKRTIAAYFAATASGPSAATAAALRHSRRLQSVQRGRQPRRLRNEKRPLDITVSE
jgi:hypothetical protein